MELVAHLHHFLALLATKYNKGASFDVYATESYT